MVKELKDVKYKIMKLADWSDETADDRHDCQLMYSIAYIACQAKAVKEAVDSCGNTVPTKCNDLGHLISCLEWVDLPTTSNDLGAWFDTTDVAKYDTWLRNAKTYVSKAVTVFHEKAMSDLNHAIAALNGLLASFSVDSSGPDACGVKEAKSRVAKKQAHALKAMKRIGNDSINDPIFQDAAAAIEKADGLNVLWGMNALVIRENAFAKGEAGAQTRGKVKNIYDLYLQDLRRLFPTYHLIS